MECVLAIEEMTRNLLMLVAWVPSMLLAIGVFLTVFSRYQQSASRESIHGTARALGLAAATLFGTWISLLAVGALLLC